MKKLEINQMENSLGGTWYNEDSNVSYENCVKMNAGIGLILGGELGLLIGLLSGLSECTCPVSGC